MPKFPYTRPRRNRQTKWTRSLVQENHLLVSDLIWPLFVQEETGKTPISSMPGQYRHGINSLIEQVKKAQALGIPAVALFPQTPQDKKSPDGEEAYNPNNLICRAVRAIKENAKRIGVICDVALDPFTTHGQDGLLRDGVVVNDPTLEALCKQAVNQAEAGCDVIAPSDMMDGRIGAIRKALDEASFQDVLILAYSAKYASAFYGPFRDAVGSKSALGQGDKRTYQMNPANGNEALLEVELDIEEGADMFNFNPKRGSRDQVKK